MYIARKINKLLSFCAAIIILIASFTVAVYADEDSMQMDFSKWKDFSVGSNSHTFSVEERGIVMESVLERGVIASANEEVFGGYAEYVYESDLKNLDSYTVEFTVEENWLEDASNYAYYTVTFTDEPCIWYASRSSVLMQIYPAGGDLSNGGAVRFILRCLEENIYYDVQYRVPFDAFEGSLSANRVRIEMKWEETDAGDSMAVYFNNARLNGLVDASGAPVEEPDAELTSFIVSMPSLYVGFGQEYLGCPQDEDGVCRSVVTEICGMRLDNENGNKLGSGCGASVKPLFGIAGASVIALTVVVFAAKHKFD